MADLLLREGTGLVLVGFSRVRLVAMQAGSHHHKLAPQCTLVLTVAQPPLVQVPQVVDVLNDGAHC